MWDDSTLVFGLVAVTAVLMASNRIRFDVIALMVVLALMLSGILTVPEALSGFGSPVVILVAGLLVVGEMLDRTGVAAGIGNWILHKGGDSETRLYVLIMLSAGVLGAVMSSTAIVAIFIPIVLRIAAKTGLQASRLLLPMSYAALISGMLTLIATTPNIVVSEELKSTGHQSLGFFSFSPVGIAVLAVAIVYILVFGRRLLPTQPETPQIAGSSRRLFDIWKDYRTELDYVNARLAPGSPLAGAIIEDSGISARYNVRILSLFRGKEHVPLPLPSMVLKERDSLLLVGRADDINRLLEEQNLAAIDASEKEIQRWMWDVGASTLLIHPESELVGKSLHENEFRSQYHLHVLGMRREGDVIEDFLDTRLAPFDSLFVYGRWPDIEALGNRSHDFVVMETPAEKSEIVPSYRKMPVALAILAGMVLLSVFDLVPLTAAVLLAGLAAVTTRCLTMEDAYRGIHWSSIVLVAGMLPLADALDKTGGTDMVVDTLMLGVGDIGPYGMMSVLFFLTAGLGLFLSNTASAVLVAPVAILAAESLGVSPYPFAVAVLIAASAAFVTPFSTPVVTLVVEPGKYSFADFIKLGIPLLVLTWITTLLVTPLVFPFQPG